MNHWTLENHKTEASQKAEVKIVGFSEPPLESNPANVSEPRQFRKPGAISEPSNKRKPRDCSEPLELSNPTVMSEPSTTSNPEETSEPFSKRKPNTRSEPSKIRNPNGKSEPVIDSNLGKDSEPLKARKPDKSSVLPRIHNLVDVYYDVQDVRIRSFNRLRQVGEVEGVHPEALKTLEKQISDYIKEEIKELPIVYTYLRGIKGIGPILAGGIVSWFDPSKAPHISSFWKYAGLHVRDGQVVKRRKGEKLDFNLKVRTFCWKLADSFIKQRTEPYRNVYDQAKKEEAEKLSFSWIKKGEKIEVIVKNPKTCPRYNECVQRLKVRASRTKQTVKKPPCKLHVHRRASRKMVKRFLADLWLVWRRLEGLPVSEPYAVAILHHDKVLKDVLVPAANQLSTMAKVPPQLEAKKEGNR